MPLKVNTVPAKLSDDMDDYLKLSIKTSNQHIEQMAEDLKNSPMLKLDPKDGREMTITLKVNQETGAIEYDRNFKLP